MTKTVLTVLGLLVVLAGILGLTSLEWAALETWYAIVMIVVGAIGVIVALSEKTAA